MENGNEMPAGLRRILDLANEGQLVETHRLLLAAKCSIKADNWEAWKARVRSLADELQVKVTALEVDQADGRLMLVKMLVEGTKLNAAMFGKAMCEAHEAQTGGFAKPFNTPLVEGEWRRVDREKMSEINTTNL